MAAPSAARSSNGTSRRPDASTVAAGPPEVAAAVAPPAGCGVSPTRAAAERSQSGSPSDACRAAAGGAGCDAAGRAAPAAGIVAPSEVTSSGSASGISTARPASRARSSTARQTQAFVTTSWQDLATAAGHSHARYARALGRLEVGASSRVSETFQEVPMPSKAFPRASKKLPRASERLQEVSKSLRPIFCKMFKIPSFLPCFC